MSRKAIPEGGSPTVSDPPVSPVSSSVVAPSGNGETASGIKNLASPSLLSDLLRAFRRRWLLASTLGLLVGGLVGALLWLFLPPEYSAEVRLRLAPSPKTGEEDEIGRFQRTQIGWIQSSTFLEAVLRRPEVLALTSFPRQGDSLDWLGRHLTVEGGPTLDLVQIRVSSRQADEAAQLAQVMVEVYQREAAAQREASLRQLQETRQRTEAALRQKRQRLAQLESTRLNAAEKEGQQARIGLRVAQAELVAWEQRRGGIDRVTVNDGDVDLSMRDDPEARRRNAEVAAADEQIRQVIRVSVLKERDPSLPPLYRQREEALKRLKSRREEVRQIVEQQVRIQALEDYRKQLVRLRERVASYEGLVHSLEEEVQKLGGAAAAEQQKTLREDIAAESESVRKLDAEMARAESMAAVPAPEAKESATVQPKDTERRVQLAGLGGAGSCALLVLAVSWRELRVRRITAASDLARRLNLPVVGNIPEVRGRRETTLADLDEQGHVSEAVDALRTVLLHDGGSGPRLLLVTSAVAGEGKTSLAVRLAASLARGWRKTLFIDANLRKPEAHTLLETPLEPGLSELLRGEAELADVIQPTGLSRLWMISAGHWDTHAIQALAQDGAGRLFERLKEQFDFIVLDSCPVLPVADVLLLSNYVDSVLLAVRSGFSRLPLVQAAQQRLATIDSPLRGAVLIGQDSDLGVLSFSRDPKGSAAAPRSPSGRG